jgi:ferredoxin-NADP reductase
MLNPIDNFLNKITMYRLVLYCLLFLLGVAAIFGFFHILSYNPVFLLIGVVVITILSAVFNALFARFLKAQTNFESVYISALILALLITPLMSFTDMTFFSVAFWATLLMVGSKFILTIQKKHVFNPVALSVVITALVFNLPASWWVGTAVMLPFVCIVGFLIVRKTLRTDLVVSFFAVAFIAIIASHFTGTASIWSTTQKLLFDTPIIFFATIMLTEPLTTPPTRALRIWYGALVGFLYAPFIHIGSLYSTPEIALVIGNIYSYVVSPKEKLFLKLKEKKQITPNIYDFIFESNRPLKFQAGQYLEWTLGHVHVDARGNRRYFTIASSPTERDIILGAKFYEPSSSFKKTLLALQTGDEIIASQLSGEFILPKDKTKKLVFIAGGIGVTPFRSMIKYLIDSGEKRDIVFIYSNYTASDIAYTEIFDEAEKRGMKIIYAISKEDEPKDNPALYYGKISMDMIVQKIPDFHERYFYISGTHQMVNMFEQTMLETGVQKDHIKIDFFPGFV